MSSLRSHEYWHTTKCGAGRIWTVTICGSLGPICGSVITVGLGLGFGSGSGLELREADKMRINHVIKTDQWRCAPQSPQIRPAQHFVVSHEYSDTECQKLWLLLPFSSNYRRLSRWFFSDMVYSCVIMFMCNKVLHSIHMCWFVDWHWMISIPPFCILYMFICMIKLYLLCLHGSTPIGQRH